MLIFAECISRQSANIAKPKTPPIIIIGCARAIAMSGVFHASAWFLGLGRLPDIPDIDQKVVFLDRLNELIKGKPTLFNSCIDEKIEQLAQHYYKEIKSKKKIDRVSTSGEDFDLINLK